VYEAGNDTEDLLADPRSILYSFCACLYGQRRAKRKTEAVIRTLEAEESEREHATR
jgi:putative resolvase